MASIGWHPLFSCRGGDPYELVVRARETSIFRWRSPAALPIPARMEYGQLLRRSSSLDRTLQQIHEKTTSADAQAAARRACILTLLGLGAVTVRPHDRRLFLLALWFWIGFLGVIVTVETPNLQRMATAVPLIALFPALVLDDLARRAESLAKNGERRRWMARMAATAAATLAAGVLAWREGDFYFRRYAAMDGWPYTRVEGQTVAHHGRDASS